MSKSCIFLVTSHVKNLSAPVRDCKYSIVLVQQKKRAIESTDYKSTIESRSRTYSVYLILMSNIIFSYNHIQGGPHLGNREA